MVIYIFYRPKPLILLGFRITTYHGKVFLRECAKPLMQLDLRAYRVNWYVFRFAGNYMVFSTKKLNYYHVFAGNFSPLPRSWWQLFYTFYCINEYLFCYFLIRLYPRIKEPRTVLRVFLKSGLLSIQILILLIVFLSVASLLNTL